MTYRRSRMVRVSAAAIAALLLGGCGAEVHEVTSSTKQAKRSKLSAAVLETTLRGFEGDTNVQAMVAADRNTVFVVTGEPCDGCNESIQELMGQAFKDPQYSVVTIGLPVVPKVTADAAIAAESVIFGVPDPDAVQEQFGVSVYPTLLVVSPQQDVLAVLAGPGKASEAIQTARGGG